MHEFSWLPDTLKAHVKSSLDKGMARGREELVYRDMPEGLDKPEIDGKRHIVFVCYYPYPNTIKKSMALHRMGGYHTTLIACCIREDVEIERWFDQVYEIEDFDELSALMSTASPACVSVCIQPSLLGALVLDAIGEARVVIDIYDSQFFMHGEAAGLDGELEREVLEKADMLTHKMPPEAMRELRDGWETTTPDALTHSLPTRDFFQDKDLALTRPYKLVYAGGIMPYRAAMQNGCEHMVMDPIITDTAGKELELTFFAHQNARNMFWDDQERYYEFQRDHPHFRFMEGVPFHRLPEALTAFHFGLLYDQKAISTWRHEAYVYNMATKIFSYMEAGLPLIVYDDLEYIVGIVERNGLGLVYSLDRLDEIPAMIDGCDYRQLRENVRNYRESHELETLGEALVKLYGNAS